MIALTLINRQENGYPARLSVLLPIWLFCCVGTSDCMRSLVTESPSWANARQKGGFVWCFVISGNHSFGTFVMRQKGGASIWDTSLSFKYDGPKKNWTSDTSFRKRVLYPLSYRTNRTLFIVSLNACNFYIRLKKIPRVSECRRKPKKAANQLPSKTCSDSQKSVPKLIIIHGKKASI